MIADTTAPKSTSKNSKNLVCLRSSDYKVIYQAFVSGEPRHILTWRGGVYEARARVYSNTGTATFNYVRIASEDLSNIAIAPKCGETKPSGGALVKF
jgi:hypothetical protein